MKISRQTHLRLLSALVFVLAELVAGRSEADTISVGPGRKYPTVASGVAAAQAGDTILIDPGVYIDDTAVTKVPLTIQGNGPNVVLLATHAIANDKGIIVSDASLTVSNITFSGAQVTVDDGNNGAGIRHEVGDLIVDNCVFNNNQDGILVNPISGGRVTISNSTFTGNGAGDGYSHAIYVTQVSEFDITSSTFSGTKAGHDIKSRALVTNVSNSILDDGVTGTASYAVDLPNGGVATIDKLVITKGVNSQNPSMIAFGEEGSLKSANSLTVTNSTLINQMTGETVIGVNNATTVPVVLANDTFQNVPVPLRGPGEVQASAPTITLRAPAVYSSNQTVGESYFRFYNSGGTAGTVTVSLYSIASGALLTQWVSPSIAPGASPQFPIATLEAAATQSFSVPQYYSLSLQSGISGAFQHVLYRPSDGTLSNLSTCDVGPPANKQALMNVHSSLLSEFPSSVVVFNTSSAVNNAQLGIYDARNGASFGVYTTPLIQPLGQKIVSVSTIEKALGITPSGSMFHYIVKIQNPNGFVGIMQHLVNNQQAELTTDMTASCALVAE